MNVVLEGPDGGGKSTLAELMSKATGMRVQQGSGPPRAPGEIEGRLTQYLAMTGVIFDRHPAVSQPIYAGLRAETMSEEFWSLVDRFYTTHLVIVYCRSTSVARHVVKPGEDPNHVAALTQRYQDLVRMYDSWATRRAHLTYRIGDSALDVVDIVRHVAAGSR